MAKSPSSTSSTSQPAEPKAPTIIPVFNHTNHMIDIGLTLRKAGTVGAGPEYKLVTFLPGNNKIDSLDLEMCQAHPLWHIHANRHDHRGLTGKKFKGVQLQVGLHDKEFEVEATELGERMFQLKQKKAG